MVGVRSTQELVTELLMQAAQEWGAGISTPMARLNQGIEHGQHNIAV